MTSTNLVIENQFGEQSNNKVISAEAALADKIPAKTGVQAIAALAGGADLPTTVAKVNAILAALKVVS